MEKTLLHASIRRSGGSFIMTLPLSYVEQNHLDAGSRLSIEIIGEELKVRPQRVRPKLGDLLKATPRGCAALRIGMKWRVPGPNCDP